MWERALSTREPYALLKKADKRNKFSHVSAEALHSGGHSQHTWPGVGEWVVGCFVLCHQPFPQSFYVAGCICSCMYQRLRVAEVTRQCCILTEGACVVVDSPRVSRERAVCRVTLGGVSARTVITRLAPGSRTVSGGDVDIKLPATVSIVWIFDSQGCCGFVRLINCRWCLPCDSWFTGCQ